MARRFTAAEGWKEGEPAPADVFRALGDDNRTPVGPVVETRPGRYARLVVAKGQTVTADTLTELRSAPAAEDGEQSPAAESTEKG